MQTDKSGLFHASLSKKTAVWITPANYPKYENFLPRAFRQANPVQNFVITPLFADTKPLGIIFCSQQNSQHTIDKFTYSAFKKVTALANRGLAYLIQKKAKQVA